LLGLLLALAGAGPCPALPLAPGNAWTYHAEVSWTAPGSDSVRHRTLTWTASVISVETRDTTVAATVRGWPTDLAWWEPDKAPTLSVVYCAGARVYHLDVTTGDAATLAADLLAGRKQPDLDDLILELPLHTGQLFGRDSTERDDSFYAWYVERADTVPALIRRLKPDVDDSLYWLVYRTYPDFSGVGFVPGVGVAHYVYHHNGTPADADARLTGITGTR
jgi:hypothetical protein